MFLIILFIVRSIIIVVYYYFNKVFSLIIIIIIDEVKGGFPPTSGIKEYHIKRKQGGDPVKGRGQNIPLVTDTGMFEDNCS